MKHAALLGGEVLGSLSPELFYAAARTLELDVTYRAISCPTEVDFRKAIDRLDKADAVGLNVTMPYKEVAVQLAGEVTSRARTVGAANVLTFVRDAGATRMVADNTDVEGLVIVLREIDALHVETLRHVQILGSGGAARAAAVAARDVGARDIVISARDPARAQKVADLVGAQVATLVREPIQCSLLISALPLDTPLLERIDLSACPYVLDLAYTRAGTTRLVAAARAQGSLASDGRRMLAEQAASAFSMWFGAEIARVREAMIGAT